MRSAPTEEGLSPRWWAKLTMRRAENEHRRLSKEFRLESAWIGQGSPVPAHPLPHLGDAGGMANPASIDDGRAARV
jgi:hypothetical protein